MTGRIRKSDIKLDYSLYNKFMYTGFNYMLMRINHILLDKGISGQNNRQILEIGGGTNPHYEWVRDLVFDTYTVSDVENHIQDMPPEIRFIPANELDPGEFEKKFSRIIASHVLEHLSDPEQQLLDWISMLDDNGVLSIGLPCDPGVFWHFCRRISQPKASRVYRITKEERNLIMAREHVNSIYNLLYIIDYYFKNRKTFWFPALLPVNNCNLLCIITLKKSDLR